MINLEKISLSFYTNIPTPYQQSFFNELASFFDLQVVYYSKTEGNRTWNFDFKEPYKIIVLKDNFIARFAQRWIVDFHFSWNIFKVAYQDSGKYIIVGGAYYIPNATIAMLFGKIKGKKTVYFSEPLFEVKGIMKYLAKWLCLRVVNSCCNAIFCTGQKAVNTFRTYKVNLLAFIIPYNINSEAFIKLDQEKVDSLKGSLKGNGEIIALSSGALIKRKGMDTLIKAVKEIKNPNFRLVIIGDGPEKENLRRLSGGDKRVVLVGFQQPEQIPYFFAVADLFVFASRYDGWAVVINEAIASNVPIISSNKVGAAIELITSDDLGILCESESVLAFQKAIELLIDEKRRMWIKENSLKLIPLISSSYNAKHVYEIFTNKL